MTFHASTRGNWIAVFALMAAICAAFWTTKAGAHSWYDADCCFDYDCAPVIQTAPVQHAGQTLPTFSVTTTHGSAIVSTNTKFKQSKDHQMHACIVKADGGVATVRCVYVPPLN